MKRLGLREANQDFARLVRAVRAGEEVVLLDRGRPIARVVPVIEPASIVERLEARGLLNPSRKPRLLPPFRPLGVRPGLSRAVLEEREERG
jgi:prevent-host-death family protein